MARPDKTFLVEAGEHCFRVDLRREKGGFAVARVLHAATGSAAPPPGYGESDPFFTSGGQGSVDAESLASLLKQSPRPAAEVTVLSDRVTAVVTDLPGIGEDWRGSAEMEAQTVSGLASSESVSASTRLSAEGGIVRAWVVQAAMRDLATLRGAISRASRWSRLVSVGHPGGIRVSPTAAQLESWPEFALFHASKGERIDLRGWNGPEAFSDALGDPGVATALASVTPPAQFVSTRSGELPGEEAVVRIDLATEAAVANWAGALARACDPLSGNLLGMPLVPVPKPPPSSAALGVSAAACAGFILLLLGAHYFFSEMNRKDLESELSRLRGPADRLSDDRKKITSLKKELEKLTAEAEAAAGGSGVDVFAHRKRIGALLAGISAGGGVEGTVVLKIVPDGLETTISGVATSFNSPQELARRIDEKLADRGWRASLVRRTAKLLHTNGGPWTYEIRLTPGRPVLQQEGEPEESWETAAATSPEGGWSRAGHRGTPLHPAHFSPR